MIYNSKSVVSEQSKIHENLVKIVKKFQFGIYKKPICMGVVKNFEKILIKLSEGCFESIIFDWGCGIGQSTYLLALDYPNSLIVGVDKSVSRLQRKNHFKNKLPNNMLLFEGNLVDWWKLVAKQKQSLRIHKHFILFPNPYPKKKHLKLRWHGQPIFQSIMEIGAPLELRSNWKVYVEEFAEATKIYFPDQSVFVEKYEPDQFLTPFEKKYFLSGQNLYRYILE